MDVSDSRKFTDSPNLFPRRRIDLHHHFFPSTLEKAKKNLQVGWRTPPENLPWTPKVSLNFMDAFGIDIAILSLPPSSAGTTGPENRAAAKTHNASVANICKQYPTRFGFFASLPFLNDTEGDDNQQYLEE
jgi:6-methylsalicylate decarboxylase